ncbi:proteinase inhibitor I4 serpin [Niabella ginsenosidivorans]|uniref:Proteinase inhibitor I4 serpin n=1 Tax=Niabella ginsenosidivorans TaxID=1176587 RepID=A0A1A9IBC9_9BACT|nr:serpin family protein [Niabella ginsenosidivorans]ANH83874.1 proteinase inhibitor I4 serpin [Niabella ginsenosidivorans]
MRNPLAISLTGLAITFLISCSKTNNGGTDPGADAPITPIALSAPVHHSLSGFAFNCFRQLQKEKDPGDNIFISPLSLHIAMGMVANGATGDTRSEIIKTLGAENLSMDELNQSYLTLLEKLPKADPKVSLALANSIWYKNNFSVEASFLNIMKDYFKAQVTGLPFQPSDVATINQWASDHTNGKIPEVIDHFDPKLVMLLMNALYFKGDWKSKFNTADTRTENFTKQGGSKMPVKMMHLKDTVQYAATPGFDVVQKPYGNGQFTMTILLPKRVPVSELFAPMDADQWQTVQSGLRTATVDIGLPKFTLKQEYNLNSTLQALGIKKAFTDAAQFDGFSKTPTKISFVKQNTFAAVDEEGTEAAAVTTGGIEVTSLPANPQFICNRPFGIIISETTSNSILFMGRIAQPVSQ